jgi:ribosomal protein S18 acetylase RimI-like enzyme
MKAVAEGYALRPLASPDLDAVVAIDAALSGRSRRGYFERRLASALREPKLHAQLAATGDRRLAGYILARVLEGEFGRGEQELRIEILGVRRDAQRQGVGAQLLGALAAWGRRHGIAALQTQSLWNDHAMLRWLEARGFAIAPQHVLECNLAGARHVAARDDPVDEREPEASREIDFGAPRRPDFEQAARDTADVRSMVPDDLADIVRIDRRITGRNRSDYMQHKLDEAMVDSGVRVSLTARVDGVVAGFLMARADLGDFGRTEPVAVVDTIGVDPDYGHRGLGRALLSQLIVNLGALRIECVETIVAPGDLALQGFLHDAGFVPAQRIAFTRALGR